MNHHDYSRDFNRKTFFVLIMLLFFVLLIAGIVLLVVFVGLREDDGKGAFINNHQGGGR